MCIFIFIISHLYSMTHHTQKHTYKYAPHTTLTHEY